MAKKEPILAVRTPTGKAYEVRAKGGLHYIKGNKLPYFTLTQHAPSAAPESNGAALDEIVKHWPHLKPLADLHLSDINGVPMHAEANGWYWLAGTVNGGFDQRFHSGNSTPAVDTEKCLKTFAGYVRISLQDAADLREEILLQAKTHGNKQARQAFAAWIEAQKPRWQREAMECINGLRLQVYGDTWNQEAVSV